MAGYLKQFNSGPGDKIDAELFDDEYTLISNAFDGASGHNHDGSTSDVGAFIPLISDTAFLNTVEVNEAFNEIVFNIDVTGAKTPQLKVVNGNVTPIIHDTVSIGTSGTRFRNGNFAGEVRAGGIRFDSGALVLDTLDEDDLNSDSDEVLATQQSIKAYVDSSVTGSPGIYLQSQYNTRETDLGLSGALAPYLLVPITVEEGSYVHIHSGMNASCDIVAGSIVGAIYRDSTPVSTEDFTVIESEGTGLVNGSTGRVDVDGPLTAGTYTYAIQLKEVLTTGIATQATLLLIEEVA